MTKTFPITEARKNFSTLVARVHERMDEYIITVNGKPAAVLISIEKFEVILQSRETKR